MSHMSIQKKGVSIAQARQLPLQHIGSDNSPVNEIAFQSLKRDNCLSNVFMNHVSAGKSHAFQSLKRDNCLSNTRSTSRILATRAGFNRSSATIASPTRSHPSRS